VVGSYTIGSGTNAKTFGFTWSRHTGFKVVNAPQGLGATTINGVNDAGDLVGFYTDAAGNTHGLLWAASRHTAPFAPRVTQFAPLTPTTSPTPMTSATPTISATATPTTTTSPAPTAVSSSPRHW
ncbi:MAG TPA: hypothetical protein VGA04_25145, partial [Streptosporangiaceae bacterium]